MVIVHFEICVEANKGSDDSLAYDTPGIRKREWQYPSSSWSIRHPRSSQCILLRAVYSWTSFVLFFDQTGQSAAGHKRFCWRLDRADYDHSLLADVSLSRKTSVEAWIGGLSEFLTFHR